MHHLTRRFFEVLGENAERRLVEDLEFEYGVAREAIIDAYDKYDRKYRNDILLFSNTRNFVERSRSVLTTHRLIAQKRSLCHPMSETGCLVSAYDRDITAHTHVNSGTVGSCKSKDKEDSQPDSS